MNNIDQSQNTQPALMELAAQRCLYSELKNILSLRGALALIIAVIFPFLHSQYPNAGYIFALVAGTYFIFDLFFLDRIASNKKLLATKIQEQFDTSVLSIRWNAVVAGEKPEAGDVHEYSEKIYSKSVQELHNWYSSSVSKLPLDVAQLVCQRANVWWDSKLRRIYADCLFVLSTLVSISLFFFIKDQTVTNALVTLVPFAPILKLLIEQYNSHRKAANSLDAIKTYLESTLNGVLANPLTVIDQVSARSIQDAIFRHRSIVTPIPNFFYQKCKNKYESKMSFNIEEFVNNYLAAVDATRITSK